MRREADGHTPPLSWIASIAGLEKNFFFSNICYIFAIANYRTKSMQNVYTLNDRTKANIARDLQVSSFDDVMDMDALTLDSHIEQNIGKKLRLSASLGRLIGRGSLYSWFDRLLSREWIDRKLMKIR